MHPFGFQLLLGAYLARSTRGVSGAPPFDPR